MKKELSNYMKFEFPSMNENRLYSSEVVYQFVKQLNPTVEELSDIKIIVAEAVGNAIDHAYQNTKGKITVKVSIFKNKLVEIKISDRGCGIKNIERAMQPLFTTDSTNHTGLGFSVMESFSDKVNVKSNLGEGTTVTIKKHIK